MLEFSDRFQPTHLAIVVVRVGECGLESLLIPPGSGKMIGGHVGVTAALNDSPRKSHAQ